MLVAAEEEQVAQEVRRPAPLMAVLVALACNLLFLGLQLTTLAAAAVVETQQEPLAVMVVVVMVVLVLIQELPEQPTQEEAAAEMALVVGLEKQEALEL